MTLEVTRVPGGFSRLTCIGVRGFSMGRTQEWGPSIYINDAELRESLGRTILWLEMQSGDEITVDTDRVIVSDS